jgi:hypothetical protein
MADPEMTYRVEWLTGEKRFEPREYVRLIYPRSKWWDWRGQRERSDFVRLAASHGLTVHED